LLDIAYGAVMPYYQRISSDERLSEMASLKKNCRQNNLTPLAVVSHASENKHQMFMKHREHLVIRILYTNIFLHHF
jgi:hypothetical protein